MSSSSRSSKGNHYRKGNYGSNHYQKKGILGKLFDIIGSRSGSNRKYNNYENQNSTLMNNQPIANQNVMCCSKCNAKIPTGSKFCLQCGEKVSDVLFCMGCGEKLPPDAKFCLKCGNKVGK